MPSPRSDVDLTDRQCTAHRKNGERCKAFAIKGGNVCNKHGGSAPQVRERAQQRILDAADSAAGKLVQLMRSPKVPPQIQLAAAKDLLDRAGITSRRAFEVEVTAKYEQLLPELVVDLDGEDVVDVEVEDDHPKDWTRRVVTPPKDLPRGDRKRGRR